MLECSVLMHGLRVSHFFKAFLCSRTMEKRRFLRLKELTINASFEKEETGFKRRRDTCRYVRFSAARGRERGDENRGLWGLYDSSTGEQKAQFRGLFPRAVIRRRGDEKG